MTTKGNSLCIVFFLVVLLTISFLDHIDNKSLIQNTYGHNFTPNNYAAFVASVDQFQTEVDLVRENLINNNIALAQQHANEANSIFYWDMMAQVTEKDPNISDRMKSAIDDLLNVSSSFVRSNPPATLEKEQQLKQVNQLVADIDLNAYSVINLTIAQKQAEDSNIFNQIAALLTGLFTGQNGSNTNGSNTDRTLQPLRFVELVDKVLRNYGDAYDVKFDMTDMTNMANMPMISSSSSTSMIDNSTVSNHSMAKSFTTTLDTNNNASSIDNVANYQTAEGITEKLIKLFHKELAPLISYNQTSVYRINIENGLTQLLWSIGNKASPMDVMMIVHTQIHPNLIQAFDLQLR